MSSKVDLDLAKTKKYSKTVKDIKTTREEYGSNPHYLSSEQIIFIEATHHHLADDVIARILGVGRLKVKNYLVGGLADETVGVPKMPTVLIMPKYMRDRMVDDNSLLVQRMRTEFTLSKEED